MAKAIKICRVCGKEYEACHTTKKYSGMFRWQDVACCPECGEIYLKQVLEARGKAVPAKAEPKPVENKKFVEEKVEASEVKPEVEEDIFEDEDLEEEDFDEDEDE